MKTSFTIRTATASDAESLAKIGAECFYETYLADNTPADMELHLKRTFSESLQAQELAHSTNHCLLLYHLAELAGYCLMGLSAPPAIVTGPKPIEIRRFYLQKRWHGLGGAQQLMHAAIEFARDSGHKTVWLGAFAKNMRAIAFYKRFGFDDVGSGTFVLGTSAQDDRIFALDLTRNRSASSG